MHRSAVTQCPREWTIYFRATEAKRRSVRLLPNMFTYVKSRLSNHYMYYKAELIINKSKFTLEERSARRADRLQFFHQCIEIQIR